MLKISCFILLSAVLLTSLIALSACRQGDEVFEPELPPSPCAVHELVGAAFINQAATLARNASLKTYTLTYSPVADSTITALVCDTTAYDLSALIGQVRFSGQLRAAGQEAPQPAAGQAYYSLELEDAPIKEIICSARALIAEVTAQPATLARSASLKTYTLTYSPVADSTITALVCDTTAYDLSALIGQVRFSGQLRAAGQDVPQPAAGQAYYSLELEDAPTREEEDETPPAKPDKEPEDNTPPTSPNEGEGPAIVGGGGSPNEEPEEDKPPKMPKEEEENPPSKPTLTQQQQKIIGKWKLMKIVGVSRAGKSELDYSNDNIIYNFQANKKLIITGNDDNREKQYRNGEYDYFFGLEALSPADDPELVVRINNSLTYLYFYQEGKMTLAHSYFDGADLVFERVGSTRPAENYPRAILGKWENGGDFFEYKGKDLFANYVRKRVSGRFLASIIINEDNSCKYTLLGRSDGPVDTIGRWEYLENPKRIKIYDDQSVLVWEYEIIELSESILKVKYLNRN